MNGIFKSGIKIYIIKLDHALVPCESADEVLLKPTGAQLTVEFLEEHSFSVPVMVLRRDGLGMTLPPSSFTVSDVEHYIGNIHIKSIVFFFKSTATLH